MDCYYVRSTTVFNFELLTHLLSIEDVFFAGNFQFNPRTSENDRNKNVSPLIRTFDLLTKGNILR